MSHELPRQQVIDLYVSLLDAWNRRDANAFAAAFTPSGSTVGFDGSQMNGRAEIASELASIFEHHSTAAYVAKVREIRSLGPGAALLRAVVGMVPAGTMELNSAVNAVQSVVVVLEPGGPKIALLQNTPAAFHGRPELTSRLTQELSAVQRSGRVVEE